MNRSFMPFEELLQQKKHASNKKTCDHPNCLKEGNHKAPKISTRGDQEQWYWFCLEHVKQYNQSWDFFKNYSEEEKEQYSKSHIHDFRPTHKFFSKHKQTWKHKIKDPFDFFSSGTKKKSEPTLDKGLEKALDLFDLSFPFSFQELQKSYKKLVKLYHPDRHNGKKEYEEKLKEINQVYTVLKGMCEKFM